MDVNEFRKKIEQGATALGIEFGSTRIKAVLIDYDGHVLATGAHEWENALVDGVWTYALADAEAGMRACCTALRRDVEEKYGVTPKTYGSIGLSAMMHGYIALDKNGAQLAPFQTWRNTNTGAAADELTELFQFNIPLRWTIAHLCQRMLDGEPHVREAASVLTLAGYMHYRLTGQKVLGVDDASGMFPIDPDTLDYDEGMVQKFEALAKKRGFSLSLRDLFPRVLRAGDVAGELTAEGAALLDESGSLRSGIPLGPPEGDAGTGMVATNSVAPRTGNLSAGTSAFAMIVLEKPLSKLYREIDMVMTPAGFPCAMSHANNGTTDLNAWVGIFDEFSRLTGHPIDRGELFRKLCTHALSGDPDCGGLLSYGYYSGESITSLDEGRPLFARMPDCGQKFNLANFMRAHLYTSLAAVKLGMDILLKDEGVKLERLTGHGGLFKTPRVMQKILAAAVNAPVSVLAEGPATTEGGAWGIALLAAYMADGKKDGGLEAWLNRRVFGDSSGDAVMPTPEDVAGFEAFTKRYVAGLPVERAAVSAMDWRGEGTEQ